MGYEVDETQYKYGIGYTAIGNESPEYIYFPTEEERSVQIETIVTSGELTLRDVGTGEVPRTVKLLTFWRCMRGKEHERQ